MSRREKKNPPTHHPDRKPDGDTAAIDHQEQYQSLFEDSPISLLIEDFSGIRRHLDEIRSRGVTDFPRYFIENPESVSHFSRAVTVIDVNRATLELFEAETKQDVMENLDVIFGEDSRELIVREVLAVLEENTWFSAETTARTVAGNPRDVIVNWRVAPGFEKSLSKVYVSIIDITDRKIVEQKLQYREHLLEQAAAAVKRLLMTADVAEVLNPALEILGAALDADSASIFIDETNPGDTDIRFREVYRWRNASARDELSTVEDDRPYTYGKPFQRWHALLSKGEPIIGAVEDFPKRERDVLSKERVLSLITVPIMRAPDLWGFLRFDSIRAPRRWIDTEISILMAFADGIGGILERHRVEEELKESEERWHSLFETSIDTVFFSTLDGEFVDVNPAGQALFGYTRGELLSLKLPELHIDPKQRNRFISKILEQGFVKDYEITFKKKDGSVIECLETATLTSDRDGNIIGYQGIIRDITEEKRIARELEEAKFRAEEANQTKSAFLANMSHEIRTPMNGILGFAEMLMEEPLDERQKSAVETILQSGRALLSLINNILDLSKVESGKTVVTTEPFELMPALNNTLAIMMPKALEKGIKLSLDVDGSVPIIIRSDPEKLRQILINLIGNAVKFTDRGAIDVTVTPVPPGESQDALVFSVRDTGVGIGPDMLESIFNPFAQADTTPTRRYGGTGLGLSIAKRLVEMMGGNISVESTRGVGSVFTVTLPVPGLTDTIWYGGGETLPRMIVVEDDPQLVAEYEKRLEGLPVNTEFIGTGGDIPSHVLQNDPILVVLNIDPGDAAWSIFETMKQDDMIRDIPIYIIHVQSGAAEGATWGIIDVIGASDIAARSPGYIHRLKKILDTTDRPHAVIISQDPSIHAAIRDVLSTYDFESFSFPDLDQSRGFLNSESPMDLFIIDEKTYLSASDDFVSCFIHGNPKTATPIIIVSESPVERFIHDLGARLSQCIEGSRETPGRVFDGIASTILRIQTPRDAGHTDDTITPSSSVSGKILLAEDNEINRRLILELLRRADLDATPARNGKETWEYAAAYSYDLILLDLQMPEMDGFEAKKRIRETEKNRRTPIIALTAHAMKGDREKILGEGFDGYIAKPIAKRELYEEIAAHLETTPAPPPPSRSPFDAMSGLKKEFIDSLPAEVDRLESALAAGDYADIAKCAHDLKGLGGAFGQSQLSMLGRRIEAAAKEQNGDVLSLLIESLREESDHLVNDI